MLQCSLFMTNFELLFLRFNGIFSSNRLSSHITPTSNLVRPFDYENMPTDALQVYDPENRYAYESNRQVVNTRNITNLRRFQEMLNDFAVI